MLEVILIGAILCIGAKNYDLNKKNKELRAEIEKLYQVIKRHQEMIEELRKEKEALKFWQFKKAAEIEKLRKEKDIEIQRLTAQINSEIVKLENMAK